MKFALLLLFALTSAMAADYPAIKSKVVPIQVTPRVYYVQGKPGIASAENEGFNSNAGFVVTDEGVVVIDALGTPALGNALLAAIRSVTSKPVRRVILTHYHADHFYGLEPFKAAGAEVWAHRAALEYLDGGEAERRREQRARDLFPWVDESMEIVRADRWLDEHTGLSLGGIQFEIHHLGPAHSPEDVIIVVPQEGVVFSGDILFAGRIPFVGEADSKRWLERIGGLLELKPRVMIPGHGDMSRDPAKRPRAHARLSRVPARRDGKGGGGLRAVRGGLREDGLEPLREGAGIRRGESRQCVRHLPADGARAARQASIASATWCRTCSRSHSSTRRYALRPRERA